MSSDQENNTLWKGYWWDELKIGPSGTWIMLTDAEYDTEDGKETDLAWIRHFSSITSYNPKTKKKQYRGEFRNNDRNSTLALRSKIGDERIGKAREISFYNIIHFDAYEFRETREKDGSIKVYRAGHEKEGEPIMAYQPPESRNQRKNLIENPTEDTKFFHKRFISFGPMHDKQFRNELSNAKFPHCECSGHIESIGFDCPECGNVFFHFDDEDRLDELGLSDDDIAVFGSGEKDHRCGACNSWVTPEPIPECDSCDDPTPVGSTEVVMKIKKKGSGTNSSIVIEELVLAKNFTMQDGTLVIDESDVWASDALQESAESMWDFDYIKREASDARVSAALNLKPSDQGYAEPEEWTPSKKKSPKRKRRRRI